MPLYSFICPECEATSEQVRAMKNANKKCMCACGTKMNRDFRADIPFASGGDYSKPIHSDSLAINPSQRTEHEKLFPDIKLDSQNRPVFDKFGSHEKYLKQCNLVKERKKVKPKGVRIA
jgi:putative FmdB family regulatory protein